MMHISCPDHYVSLCTLSLGVFIPVDQEAFLPSDPIPAAWLKPAPSRGKTPRKRGQLTKHAPPRPLIPLSMGSRSVELAWVELSWVELSWFELS